MTGGGVAVWRPMTGADIPAVFAMACEIHPDYPEAVEVFAERQALYPQGALVLEIGVRPGGYLISHPWVSDAPPLLDTLLGRLPDAPTTYYLHDLALLPSARGTGAGRDAVDIALNRAHTERLDTLSLVAVGASAPFWTAMGFERHSSSALSPKLASYGALAAYMTRRA